MATLGGQVCLVWLFPDVWINKSNPILRRDSREQSLEHVWVRPPWYECVSFRICT